eukprot:TRINITY_DN542_c0_g2_i1.p1 TRINITY_DN542_c0_g2~~TRINITY_DN542_c0_g2_i1.p1  ORF type:complete len:591 (+),score=69.49 TRINITY_DN542_c0_g2_i1:46-1773(+)
MRRDHFTLNWRSGRQSSMNAHRRWKEALAHLGDDILVLDGGTGTEIEKEAGLEAMDQKGWSCMCNLRNPQSVKKVHRRYLDAGSDILIANTYATNPNVMRAAGFSDEEQAQTTLAGVRLAREVINEFPSKKPGFPLLAGSLSCHPPNMPKGEEFCAGTWPDREQEIANCRRQAELLRDGGVDLIFLEMVWDLEHGERAVEAACSVDLPVFVAVCVPLPMKGPHTEEALRKLTVPGNEIILGGAGGTTITQAATQFLRHKNVVGINVHHTPLPFVEATLTAVREAMHKVGKNDLMLGVYPDHGTFKNPHWEELDLSPSEFIEHVKRWTQLTGCQLIGGCCGIGPNIIQLIADNKPTLRRSLSLYRSSPRTRPPPGSLPVRISPLKMLFMCLMVVFTCAQMGHLETIHTVPEQYVVPLPSEIDSIPRPRREIPRAGEGSRGRFRGIDCGNDWARSWFKVINFAGDGILKKQEVTKYMAEHPRLREKIARRTRLKQDRTIADLMRPTNGTITFANFKEVWKHVGIRSDPCPTPFSRQPKKPRDKPRLHQDSGHKNNRSASFHPTKHQPSVVVPRIAPH